MKSKVRYCKLRCRNLDFTVNEYQFLQLFMFCFNAIILILATLILMLRSEIQGHKCRFRDLDFFDAAFPTSAFQILISQSRCAFSMQLSRLGLRLFGYHRLKTFWFPSAVLISGLRTSMPDSRLRHFEFSYCSLDLLAQLSMPQARVWHCSV